MPLATLAEVPESVSDFRRWSFSNQASHRDIARRIFELGGAQVEQFVLDPFDPEDMGNWVWLHQSAHDQQNKALNIKGYDLTGVNWDDPDTLHWWLLAHQDEHVRASKILGLA